MIQVIATQIDTTSYAIEVIDMSAPLEDRPMIRFAISAEEYANVVAAGMPTEVV